MIQPYGRLHSLVQACGRSGRIDNDGKIRRAACVVLYEGHDIGTNVPGMTTEVRDWCKTSLCLKDFLDNAFGSGVRAGKTDKSWCCSSCM